MVEIVDPLHSQSSPYTFPYHYLPSLENNGTIAIHKFWPWGLDYMTYMTFVATLITEEIQPQSLLDVGCGDGRLLHILGNAIPRRVGIDIDEQAIRFAHAFNPDVEFFIGRLSSVPGLYDVITLIEVLEHISDDELSDFIVGIAEKLEPAGNLVVSVPTNNLRLISRHFRHYNLPSLKRDLSPEFTIEKYWFLTKQGLLFKLLRLSLQNIIGIILSRKWRRLIWRLHNRYTYHAQESNGGHLVAIASRIT